MLKKGDIVTFAEEINYKDSDGETITFLPDELKFECIDDEKNGFVLVKSPGIFAKLQSRWLRSR